MLNPWAEIWHWIVSGIFLSAYLQIVEHAPFMPEEKEEIATLLDTFLLEKAVYELGYEINNRPDWIMIPLKGIKELLKKSDL